MIHIFIPSNMGDSLCCTPFDHKKVTCVVVHRTAVFMLSELGTGNRCWSLSIKTIRHISSDAALRLGITFFF